MGQVGLHGYTKWKESGVVRECIQDTRGRHQPPRDPPISRVIDVYPMYDRVLGS